jgi:hypothetical protein
VGVTPHYQWPSIRRASVVFPKEIRCPGGADILVEFSILASTTTSTAVEISLALLVEICDWVVAA